MVVVFSAGVRLFSILHMKQAIHEFGAVSKILSIKIENGDRETDRRRTNTIQKSWARGPLLCDIFIKC
jgi:hypothetical protein